jgi:hypothetical protein
MDSMVGRAVALRQRGLKPIQRLSEQAEELISAKAANRAPRVYDNRRA